MSQKEKENYECPPIEIEGIVILNLVNYLFGTYYKKRSKCHH
jgi:hypothetical protein